MNQAGSWRWCLFLLVAIAGCSRPTTTSDSNEAHVPSTVRQALEPDEWPAPTIVATNSFEAQDGFEGSGDVAVTNAGGGPTLALDAELAIGPEATLTGSATADTIVVRERSQITGDATYNELNGSGTVSGSSQSPLSLPLPITIPSLPTTTPGSQAVSVAASEDETLASGAYAGIILESGNAGIITRLKLNGGVYHVSELAIGNDARLECLEPCEVRVAGRVFVGARSYLGPAAALGLGEGNVELFVSGTNGSSEPTGTPASVHLDHDGELAAYILAPNGTVRIGHRGRFLGKAVAKDVLFTLDSAVLSVGTCATTDTTCDGVDDDCDGTPDDDYVPTCEDGAGQQCENGAIVAEICSDSDLCNGTETCSAGACQTGTPPAIDDNNPCTEDSCDPTIGVINEPVAAGTSCADEDLCNGEEVCDGAGACMAGTPLDPNDGNACTADSCDPVGGVTNIPVPAGTSCEDGDACNGDELCDGAGACLDGIPLDPDDSNPCTEDSCDPQAGVLNTPSAPGTSCANADLCDGDELCDGAGSCVVGAPPPIDDGNACTSDFCDPLTGVSHTPLPAGTACPDADLCNGDEVCNAVGECIGGEPSEIEDGNPCTLDACDSENGVTHTPVAAGTPCADVDACNGDEVCSDDAACLPGDPLVVDDGNPCTADSCDPVIGAIHQSLAPGTSCGDGDLCNGDEICDGAGTCASGPPPTVDDGNPCTVDSCDPASGVSNDPVAPGTSCTDGDVCNGEEACTDDGECVADSAPVVDDGNPCTADSCDPVGGVSNEPLPPGSPCSDGDACNGEELCSDQVECLVGEPPVVDDGNACTIDACDPVEGVTHEPAPMGTSCGDGDVCNGAEACDGTSVCVAGPPPTMDDGNPCTTDACDPVSGVSNVALPAGTSCADADLCNGDEFCDESGTCLDGEPPVVDDGKACTIDSCDPIDGVQHVNTPAGVTCSDGDECNGVELCDGGGTCSSGTPPDLDDQNPCTADSCSPDTGIAHEPVPAGTSCADADLCNGDEVCDASGVCISGQPSEIDDENPCTADSCDPENGVQHEPLPPGTSCSDGDVCNGDETCDAEAVCQPGIPLVVDDENPCTSDICDPVSGVQHELVPAGTSCADGDLCNGDELCNAQGECIDGEPPVVDDENPCTTDTCSPELGVAHTANPGVSCGDGDVCNGDEVCDASGECASGTPPVVDDGNACTTDSCDPTEGVSHVLLPEGASCSDGDVCDGEEVCDDAGACLVGASLEVDDGDPCTTDTCDPISGVEHAPAPAGTSCEHVCGGAGTCDSEGACLPSGSTPPIDDGNPCTVDECDPELGPVFTPLPEGASCSDGDLCNGDEICGASSNCLPGEPISVDDENPCTLDQCDPSTGAVTHLDTPGGTPCVDDDLCNGTELCDGSGECVAGTPLPIDDGEPCTIDSCDPELGVQHEWLPDEECLDTRSYWAPKVQGRPSPRDSAAAAFGNDGELVLFGGENAGGTLRDTWTWNHTSNLWSVEYSSTGPSPRAAATMVFDTNRNRYVLFGGVSGSSADAGYLDDTWEYDPATRTWQLRSDGGPDPRAYAAAAYDAGRQQVVLFGGVGATTYSDTWEWDGETGVWTAHSVSGPDPRASAALAYDPTRERVVMFGGNNDDGLTYGDTWEWDGATSTWVEKAPVEAPEARTGHAMAFQPGPDRVVLHGGTNAAHRNLADLWAFDGGVWTRVEEDSTLGARVGHSLGVSSLSNTIVLHGGLRYSSSGLVTPQQDDIWERGPFGWRERTSQFAPPVSLSGVAYDEARGLLVGMSARGPRATTWELDTNAPRWSAKDALLGSSVLSPVALDELRLFTYDTARERVVYFGFNAAHTMGVWEWDGVYWKERDCTPTQAMRRSPFAHNPLLGRTYFLGGEQLLPSTFGWLWSPVGNLLVFDHASCSWTGEYSPHAPLWSNVVWDSHREVLVVFGGQSSSSSNYIDEMWEYEAATQTWTALDIPRPTPRKRALMAYDPVRQRVVLHGGMVPNDGWALSDTWEYSPDIGWVNLEPENSPPATSEHRIAWDPGRARVMLVGGPSNEVWEWDGTNWQYRPVGATPSARSGASGGWDAERGVGVMFGGVSGDGHREFLGDLWVWRGGWEWPNSGDAGGGSAGADPPALRRLGYQPPAARAGHTLVVRPEADSALLFGGEGDRGLLGDTWLLNLRGMTWDEQESTTSSPNPRTEHAVAELPGTSQLFLFGGLTEDGFSNEAFSWTYSPVSAQWKKLLPTDSPSGRAGHAMATDPSRERIVLFGGRNEAGALNDTWEFEPAALDDGQWTLLEPSVSPPPRFGHRLVYDPVREVVVLVGGASSVGYALPEDTWEWDGATWTRRDPRVPLRGRAGHVAFFDEQASELLVFGGLAYRENGDAAITFGDMWSYAGADRGDERSPDHPNGTPCANDLDCGSSLCVDGLCCNSLCDDQCGACNVAGHEGECVAVLGLPEGDRASCGGPLGECGAMCNGQDMAACHVVPSGTVCGQIGCDSGSVYEDLGECDGAGTCVRSPPVLTCAPYTCRPDLACFTSCGASAPDCFSEDYYCHVLPALGYGGCVLEVEAIGTTHSPLPAHVGEAVTVTGEASRSSSEVRYRFRIFDPGGEQVKFCLESESNACVFTPTLAGEHTVQLSVGTTITINGDSGVVLQDTKEFALIVEEQP